MNFRKPVLICFILFVAIQPVVVFSQKDKNYLDYIAKYSQAAIAEMYYSKIPASITMAQGLHESKYGQSELAINANNHFGIKCQTEWYGKRYTYQDDDANTCFRHYDSALESYRDHSDFLMKRPRYASLFKLDSTDYAAWAHGLKKCGYATNPRYAFILIKLIEDYKLFMLDTMQPVLDPLVSNTDNLITKIKREGMAPGSTVFQQNRIDFYITRQGDNVKKLTKELKLLKWEIRKYNEISRKHDIIPGQVIYLQPKRKQAEPGYSFHTVITGETMYSISQLYGIKLKWLYKRNNMKQGTNPDIGQEIWLRGMKPANKKKR